MRQIVLDTETTGLEPELGHRIIEIGCIELIDRRVTGRTFQRYLCPDRDVEQGAEAVHGLTNAFLADKPRFGEVADHLIEFIEGAELIIHNAPFDVGFLDHEFSLLENPHRQIGTYCPVMDTLELARTMHPGQRNSLDALCARYQVDNSRRQLHGALLDAQLLAEVYLAMTGGQAALSLEACDQEKGEADNRLIDRSGLVLNVVRATPVELAEHRRRLEEIDKLSVGQCIWLRLETLGE